MKKNHVYISRVYYTYIIKLAFIDIFYKFYILPVIMGKPILFYFVICHVIWSVTFLKF